MIRIAVIAGPTASGKTRLGIDLCRLAGGEVVNADSQQVYLGLDVGTAKPTTAERAEVPHHLLDLCQPGEGMDAARFCALADAAIAEMAGRGRLPVVVGGTGLSMPQRSATIGRLSRASRERHDELQDVLNHLSAAVTAGDGEGAARHWDMPAFVVDRGGVARAISSPEDVAQLFAGVRELYNARGITDIPAQILDEDWIDDRLVVAKVRWPYLDEEGHEVGAEDSDYTFCRDATGHLKVRVAVLRGVEGTKDVPPS